MKKALFILLICVVSISSFAQRASKKFCYGIHYSARDSFINGKWEDNEFSEIENSVMILSNEEIQLILKGHVSTYNILSFEENEESDFVYLIQDIQNPSLRHELKLSFETLNKIYISIFSRDEENNPSSRITMISSYWKPETE